MSESQRLRHPCIEADKGTALVVESTGGSNSTSIARLHIFQRMRERDRSGKASSTREADGNVREYYERGEGWRRDEEDITTDARHWEDLRPCATDYVRDCRLRVLDFLPTSGRYILDAASGPIQYPEYLEYSKSFEKRYCVDFSASALEEAEAKIGTHGSFFHADILELDFEPDFFDAVISLHTIYHIDAQHQEEAVRKLLSVVRPGRPVVIVYGNPKCLFNGFGLARAARSWFGVDPTPSADIYFHLHPLPWWRRFEDVAQVEIHPWRSIAAQDSHRIVPDNRIGSLLFSSLFKLEGACPRLFAQIGRYPIVVLTKHPT